MMESKDFAQVEHQLQAALKPEDLWKADLSAGQRFFIVRYAQIEEQTRILGNWSGEEVFYETSRRPMQQPRLCKVKEEAEILAPTEFTSIISEFSESPSFRNLSLLSESVAVNDVGQSSPSADLLQSLQIACELPGDRQNSKAPSQHLSRFWFAKTSLLLCSESPNGHERPEVSHCKARLSSLFVCLLHHDPFASQTDSRAANALLQQWVDVFFSVSGRHTHII